MVLAPVVPAGVIAVIDVAETTEKLATELLSIVTLVAPVKLVPVRVIVVPPRVDPVEGVAEIIVGGSI